VILERQGSPTAEKVFFARRFERDGFSRAAGLSFMIGERTSIREAGVVGLTRRALPRVQRCMPIVQKCQFFVDLRSGKLRRCKTRPSAIWTNNSIIARVARKSPALLVRNTMPRRPITIHACSNDSAVAA
jgi:hypothetical protein